MSNNSQKYDKDYPKFICSAFPPENYKPLSDADRRELIYRLSAKVREDMEIEAKRGRKGCQEAPTDVLHSSLGVDSQEPVLHSIDHLNMPSKVCRDCGEDKPISEYYDRSRGKYGKHASCKVCMKASVAARRNAA